MKNRIKIYGSALATVVSLSAFAGTESDIGVAGSAALFVIPTIVTAPGCVATTGGSQTSAAGASGALRAGVCRFHEAERSTAGSAGRPARKDLWRSAIDDLNRAQTQGLTGNEHAFAALIEGLTHCRRAQEVLAETPNGFDPAQASAAQYDMFCSSRRQALAAFSDIDWGLLNARYESVGLTVDQHLGAMEACYSGPLSSGFDSACGLVTELPLETINSIVEQETEAALYQAFDSAGAPVDALIGKKIERTRAVVDDVYREMTGCTRSEIENPPSDHACQNAPLAGSLEASATIVTSQHIKMRSAIQSIEPTVEEIVQSYRQAILSGYAVLDEYNRWKDGLYDQNLKTTLTQRLKDLKDASGDFRAKDATTNRSAASDAAALAPAVTRMAKSGATRIQAMKGLCQIVFCEFYEWNRLDEDTVPSCTEANMATNPLCVDQNYVPKNGGKLSVTIGTRTVTQKVTDLCTAVGLPASFATVGISNPTACFANYHLPE